MADEQDDRKRPPRKVPSSSKIRLEDESKCFKALRFRRFGISGPLGNQTHERNPWCRGLSAAERFFFVFLVGGVHRVSADRGGYFP